MTNLNDQFSMLQSLQLKARRRIPQKNELCRGDLFVHSLTFPPPPASSAPTFQSLSGAGSRGRQFQPLVIGSRPASPGLAGQTQDRWWPCKRRRKFWFPTANPFPRTPRRAPDDGPIKETAPPCPFPRRLDTFWVGLQNFFSKCEAGFLNMDAKSSQPTACNRTQKTKSFPRRTDIT